MKSNIKKGLRVIECQVNSCYVSPVLSVMPVISLCSTSATNCGVNGYVLSFVIFK